MSKKSSGFSIVEVMIAAAIFALIGSAVATFMRKQSNAITSMRFVSTRDMMKSRLATLGASPRAILNSVEQPENGYLKKCLKGSGCISQKKQPFALYDSIGSTMVAGAGAAAPARYTIDGARCAQKSSQCPLEVYAEVGVGCNNSVCSSPSDIQVEFTIRQADGVRVPGMATLKTENGVAPQVRVEQLLSGSTGIGCIKRGEFLRGILPDGSADCAPLLDALGLRIERGLAATVRNPNAAARTGECGWAPLYVGQARMRHVIGTVCCAAGEVAIGGGGVCNAGSGGFMESSKPTAEGGRSCWFVDCCKYPKFDASPMWVQCIAAPGVNPASIIPNL